jgi:myosin-crossreactive antigen
MSSVELSDFTEDIANDKMIMIKDYYTYIKLNDIKNKEVAHRPLVIAYPSVTVAFKSNHFYDKV